MFNIHLKLFNVFWFKIMNPRVPKDMYELSLKN